MTAACETVPAFDLLVGYDGSPSAAGAIEFAGRLMPGARTLVAYILGPPFGSPELRRRLWPRARSVDDMIAMTEREGLSEAERLMEQGVTLAQAAGLQAAGRVEHSYAGDGVALASLAEQLQPGLVVVGSRGLGGTRALMGSESDAVVHYCPRPVLVVAQHLLTDERDAASDGPVVVAFDGSEGARHALRAAADLFPARKLLVVSVDTRTPTDAEFAATGIADIEAAIVKPAGALGSGRAIAAAIAAFAAQREASVIVVGSRGQSASREVLLGSAAMATLHHGRRAVVVVGSPHD